MTRLRRHLLSALTVPGIRAALRPFRRGVGTIFMLHRLTDPASGSVGDDPAELRRTLGLLRRRGYEIVSLDEMFRRLREADPGTDLGVAFTLDDGYAEQVSVAGPVFAEFDCPATVFVTTGFLDRTIWQWWDRIEYLFEACRRRAITLTLAGSSLEYRWDGHQGRAAARDAFIARCKQVSEEEKNAAIARLGEAAEVELPSTPPPRYAPMSWPEVRLWESRGMTFGAHTMTHPILARTSDQQSRQEIAGSWERLRSMADRPTRIFCYPNGQHGDFGPREWSTLEALGLEGALAATHGYAELKEFREAPQYPYAVRRFGYPGDPRLAAHFASGAERLRSGTGRRS